MEQAHIKKILSKKKMKRRSKRRNHRPKEKREREECKVPETSVRPGTNPGSNTRRPGTAKRQIHRTHSSVVKIQRERNEEDSASLGEEAAVANLAQWDDKKVQDEDATSTDRSKNRSGKINSAGGKGAKGTHPGVKAGLRSSSVP